jgi:CRP-like cAMP-binding protein
MAVPCGSINEQLPVACACDLWGDSAPETAGPVRSRRPGRRCASIFTQGDVADAVFYIRQGKVKLTVVSRIGKEASLGILSEGDFFGEAH